MKKKLVGLALGVSALSAMLYGCGNNLTTTKAAGPTNTSAASSQHSKAQHSDPMQWISVRVQQVGRLPLAIGGTSLEHSDNGQIIAVGGYTGAVSVQSVLQVFPKARSDAKLPLRTHDAASGYIGKNLYVFGGGQAVSYNTIVRVQNQNAQTIGTLPAPLSDAVCVPWAAHGTTGLLLIGGYDGQTYRRTVDYLQTQHNQLVTTHLFRLPVGLRYTGAVAANGMVYLVGGQTPNTISSAVYRWSPQSGTRVIAHLPEGIQKAAVFQTNGFLVVIGGVLPDGKISSDIYAIRLSNGAVKKIGSLQSPLADMGYTQVGTNGYLVGGDTGNGYSSKVLKVSLN